MISRLMKVARFTSEQRDREQAMVEFIQSLTLPPILLETKLMQVQL